MENIKNLLNSFDIDIMKNKVEFKTFGEVMSGLSSKWGSLTEVQQNEVCEIILGKE
jgi:hypothetical protein